MPIADVTTTAIDAYNHFFKGREATEKMYWKEARESLEKAVQLDSTFAAAYRYLSVACRHLGNAEARNEAAGKAKTFSEKATEKERLYINASYAATIEGDQEKRIQILREMAKKYPKEKRVHHASGDYYFN